MATEKQKLARARNYFKFVLSGVPKPIQLNYLTEEEREEWTTILNIRDGLIDKLDARSRAMGLAVPPRCWCGEIGKYPMDCEFIRVRNVTHLCKEHRE